MNPLPCPPMLRRRRTSILCPLIVLTLLFLFLFSSSHDLFGLPPVLQGLQRVSPANIAALIRQRPGEIHGLLYYAIHSNQGLAHDTSDPTQPLDLSIYEDRDAASSSPDWSARMKLLDAETPLVVFSKTYCPYSKRAKDLLERYDLSPKPRIIEVDLRDDGDFIKTVLTRLTGRSTFPNAILLGKSIGGSNELAMMHKDRSLRQLFEDAGLKVRSELKDDDT